MKKLLFALVLFLSLSGYGQKRFIESWRQTDAKDSADFVWTYGSVDEYNYQRVTNFRGGNAYRSLLIEAKWIYAVQLVQYISDENMCGFGYGIEDGKGEKTLVCLGCSVFKENSILADSIFIKMKLYEKEDRIKSVAITGPEQYLIRLFKGYWDVSDEDMLTVVKGNKISVNRMDDLVTFDWTGRRAVIRITQSPMVKNYRHLLINKK